ncbi:hypothetical protein JCM11491_004140 [Sporobolomyces phaffii]
MRRPNEKEEIAASSGDTDTALSSSDSTLTDPADRRRRHRRRVDPHAVVAHDAEDSSDDSDRDNGGGGGGRESRTMHSLSKWTGVQRTQMKHLLSPGKAAERFDDDDDQENPLFDDGLSPPETKDAGDHPESIPMTTRAEMNRRVNERALSRKRLAYIAGTVVVCVALVVVGVVLGLGAVRARRREGGGEFADPALAADHASLVVQGETVQDQLGAGSRVAVDHSKAELDPILDDDDDDDGADLAPVAIPISSFPGSGSFDRAHSSAPATTSRVVVATEPALVHASFPELKDLFAGNQRFINERQKTNSDSPGLISKLGLGQTPHFALLGCSDSRVSETVVLDAKIGDLFVTRNIGNQFLIDSLSTESVFSYAISHLGVSHLVVLGHTKCGAVLASIVSESNDAMSDIGENRIMTWIRPIRSLFLSSTRREIVEFRTAMATTRRAGARVTARDVTSTVWNAVIEENVKAQVRQLGKDPSVLSSWKRWGEANHDRQDGDARRPSRRRATGSEADSPAEARGAHRPAVELWIHGFVYDVDTGLVHDLGVSIGPRFD